MMARRTVPIRSAKAQVIAASLHCQRTGPGRCNGTEGPCGPPWSQEFQSGGEKLAVPSGGTCPSCSCGPAEGVFCGVEGVLYDQLGCSGASAPIELWASGACSNTGIFAIVEKSIAITSDFKVLAGKCSATASGTAGPLPPAKWASPISNLSTCDCWSDLRVGRLLRAADRQRAGVCGARG